MTNRKIEYWVIPPESDAEFVASMEEVLDIYAMPYDPDCPVVCMDEQPIQLFKETRTPISATAKHAKGVNYEYERAGTANIFMFTEALAGWREVAVRVTKTKFDWAVEMARILEGRYADCEKVILVCDNLNTHTKGAFYEAFDPERARQRGLPPSRLHDARRRCSGSQPLQRLPSAPRRRADGAAQYQGVSQGDGISAAAWSAQTLAHRHCLYQRRGDIPLPLQLA